jgi:hypothetical protein
MWAQDWNNLMPDLIPNDAVSEGSDVTQQLLVSKYTYITFVKNSYYFIFTTFCLDVL